MDVDELSKLEQFIENSADKYRQPYGCTISFYAHEVISLWYMNAKDGSCTIISERTVSLVYINPYDTRFDNYEDKSFNEVCLITKFWRKKVHFSEDPWGTGTTTSDNLPLWMKKEVDAREVRAAFIKIIKHYSSIKTIA